MKLTKKRAIELTLELWTWLYENPDKYKDEWPAWKANGGKYDDVDYDCFVCEYTFSRMPKKPDVCGGCPLLPLWPNSCTSDGSIYMKWSEGSCRDRREYAKQIVDFCKKELAK